MINKASDDIPKQLDLQMLRFYVSALVEANKEWKEHVENANINKDSPIPFAIGPLSERLDSNKITRALAAPSCPKP